MQRNTTSQKVYSALNPITDSPSIHIVAQKTAIKKLYMAMPYHLRMEKSFMNRKIIPLIAYNYIYCCQTTFGCFTRMPGSFYCIYLNQANSLTVPNINTCRNHTVPFSMTHPLLLCLYHWLICILYILASIQDIRLCTPSAPL